MVESTVEQWYDSSTGTRGIVTFRLSASDFDTFHFNLDHS